MITPRGLSDEELDAALAAGDAQLLDHVRAHADLTGPSNIHHPPDPPTTLRPSDFTSVFDDPYSRAFVITLRIRIRNLDLCLARSITLALDRESVHAHHLAVGIEFAHHLARRLSVGLAIARDLERARALAIARDLERARALGIRLELSLARALRLARDRALATARDLERADAIVRDLEHASAIASNLDQSLSWIPVDVSGADLTGLELGEDLGEYLHVLMGVVWNRDTRWPPGVGALITPLSEKLEPGVWRVGGGTEGDPQEASSA